jgi:hypothetical protein
MMNWICHGFLLMALLNPTLGHAETKEEWIELGARIHGGLAPSSRLASGSGWTLERLKVGPRVLSIVYDQEPQDRRGPALHDRR